MENICGCKGIRTCLVCEKTKNKTTSSNNISKAEEYQVTYSYCVSCKKGWPGWNTAVITSAHPYHTGNPFPVEDITVVENFITEEEEQLLVKQIDSIKWVTSQSGRRKQDFGPKVNFKKQKVHLGSFRGFPDFTKSLVDRLTQILDDFSPVELCHLEYVPSRGSAIDPHVDDTWLWGERLVTVNLLSDTVLTLIPVLSNERLKGPNQHGNKMDIALRVPLTRRSLFVLAGPLRHSWTHQILRDDVTSRRLAMTFRELSLEFTPGGQFEKHGQEMLYVAKHFVSFASHSN
ncbi:alpha-ketoglutarate-dependent dioxygenase alkB homolog 4 isoform X1 [Tachypleus tridentatus]|uniref:alpha-ketoglutarate-dependent dioxygenase alkB homolog 4 isoform X1 n=1 Tax=Tachypleus tridentatus TaxID=6853 RepID=UPI003FD0B666